MIAPGQIISHTEMCLEEGLALQRGMNHRVRGGDSVLLMSRRSGAPYADRIEDDGRTLIYEGHDTPHSDDVADPKCVDQPATTPSGHLTQNGLFYEAAMAAKRRERAPDSVRVYEKIKQGIWTFVGRFHLIDAWTESDGRRRVFRFRLVLADSEDAVSPDAPSPPHTRLIPSHVKQEVWRRDGGRCVICGATDNLHFDHVIPFSRGGSSLTSENVQLLCARHNLAKRDRIQ